MRERLVVGCMTGTSLDGLDAALVRIRGTGLAMTAGIVAAAARPFEAATFAQTLRDLAAGAALNAERITNAALAFSLFHAEVIREALNHAGMDRPDLVSVHGQTVFHAPPRSWQLFNPWPLARAIGAPVVFDLRGADLAADGQGAPITPLADWILFRSPSERVAVVNLGGFCNFTWLPPGRTRDAELGGIRAGDVCACNHVLDGVARAVLGEPFDAGGRCAHRGEVNEEAAAVLQEVLTRQSRAGRSLGTGDESLAWITTWKARLRADDLARSAVEAVAKVIATALPKSDRVYFAGGGVRHEVLARRLRELVNAPAPDVSAAGVPSAYREAMCMAVLGALCQDRVPITLPRVTGSTARLVAGSWVEV